MTTIFLVVAENPCCPPAIIRPFATREGAEKEVVELVNIMLGDACHPADADIGNYEARIESLQDEHGAQFCYAYIDEQELRP